MKVLICSEPGKMEYAEKPIPTPAAHELLLKINTIGICGTDLHAFNGNQPYFTYPRILGHEIGASVADANGHDHFTVGEAVTIMPYFYCGNCFSCRKSRTNCCSNLKVAGVHIDGAMQEYFCVPASSAINKTGLAAEQLAIVEPFAIGEHALSRAGVNSGNRILILGAGPIGIGIALLALYRKAEVTIADPDPYRLDLCRTVSGLNFIDMSKENIQERIMELTEGDGAEFVFEASGNLKAIESTIGLLAHGGKIILVGIQKQSFTFHHPDFHKKETTLMSSRNAVPADFENVIKFFNQPQSSDFHFINNRIRFENAASWFMDANTQKNKIIKSVISFD